MDGLSNSINSLRQRLETAGSVFSYEEIHEILSVMKDVQLKLIVANVPSEVFSSDAAREAFESLFKSFDIHSKFVYLPSFKRAQIYMTTPEATLCARLQTQGWKLPTSIPRERIDFCEESDPQNDGIACFIDQVDCTVEGDTDEAFDSASFEDEDENSEDDSEIQKQCIHCLSYCNTEFSSGAFASHVTGNIPSARSPSGQVNTIKESTSNNEGENASDVSGDDTVCMSTEPPMVTRTSLAQEQERDKPPPLCRKHRRLERLKSEKQHLAPPKPSRLFLLSPPCSPPVGWQPKPESEPVINYDLLEALAALAPGEQFELHPRNEQNSHPSIVITPCEHTTSPSEGKQSRAQIVQTRCPDRNSQ